MKLKCDGLALSEAVLKVIKAMPVKKNNSILEGIKLKAQDGFLTLTATDLELTITKKITADIKIEGEVLIYGKVFAEFVRSINHEEISLECTDSDVLHINYGDNSVVIKCMDLSSYPLIDNVEAQYTLTIKKDELKDLINKTYFSAAQEDGRPILKGCLFEVYGKELTVVSLDGYRLSLARKTLEESNADNQKFVIPARSLNEIVKFTDEAEDTIDLVFDKDKLLVDINNTVVISRLITSEFINYRNIITTGFNTKVTFNKNEFADSIYRATIMTKSGKNNLVKLDIKDSFILIDANSDLGVVNETIPASVEGKETIVCFNGKYLLDFLNVIDEEFISMNIRTNNAPCVFTQVEGNDYLFLVLPMKVSY